MRLVSFDGFNFEDNDYWVGMADDGRGQWSIIPTILPRRDSRGALAGGTISERAIPVQVGYDGADTFEVALLRFMGKINPSNTSPRLLVGELNDGTDVECDAIVTIPNGLTIDNDTSVFQLTFISVDPIWRERTDSTTSPATHTIDGNNWDGLPGIAIANNGQATAYPELSIGWTTAPSAPQAEFGWKYRKRITVSNDTGRDWFNEIVSIDIGDTAALVSGSKALSTGDDALLFLYGKRVRRHFLNWNTKSTLLFFVVERLAADDDIEYEMVYGNADVDIGDGALELNRPESSYPVDAYIAIDLGEYSGTATSGGASTLTDSGATWSTNRWAGGYIYITGGTATGQGMRITSNTGTAITVDRPWIYGTPDATSTYVIWMSGQANTYWDASSASSTTITDSSQVWRINEWTGATANILSGTGNGQSNTVASNTATTLTFSSAFGTPPDSTSTGNVTRAGQRTYLVNSTNVAPNFYTQGRKNWGLWRISRSDKSPGRVWYGDQISGGWIPFLRLDNNDDYAVSRFYKDGSYYWPELRARRRRQQDGRLAEEGQADSVGIYDPRGYIGMYFDYQSQNPSSIAMMYVAGQEPGGEDWSNEIEDTTAHTSLTAVSAQYLDFTANPYVRLAMGVLPADGESEIGRTVKSSYVAEMRTYKRLELIVDPRNWSVTASSEESIYDLQVTLNLAPGIRSESGNAVYRHLHIGHSDDNARHLFLKTSESLKIITDPLSTDYPAAIYNGSTFVRSVPWAISATETIYPTGDDAAVTLSSRDWWPMEPSPNLLTNPTFATDTTGWAEEADSGTTAWSRDSGTYYDAAGSAKAVISANGVALGDLISRFVSTAIPVIAGNTYAFSGFVQTTHADLYPIIGVRWYDSGSSYLSESNLSYPGTPIGTGAWYPTAQTNEATAPATAAYAKVVCAVISLNAASTGTCYFDALTFGTHVFTVEHAATSLGWGVATFTPSWREGYYG